MDVLVIYLDGWRLGGGGEWDQGRGKGIIPCQSLRSF